MPVNRSTYATERAALDRGARERDPARQHRKRELNGLRTGSTMTDDFLANRHVPTNRITDRMLSSGVEDGQRAVTGQHVRRGTLGNTHIDDLDGQKIHFRSISDAKIDDLGGDKLHTGSVTNGKIDTMDGSKLHSTSVGNGKVSDLDGDKLFTSSVGNGKISSLDGSKLFGGSVTSAELDDGLNGGSDSSYRLRQINRGTGPGAAGESHSHGSVNFVVDYTEAEQQHTIALRATVEANELRRQTPEGQLLLSLARQLIDHPGMRAEQYHARLRDDPDFYHHEMMHRDPAYNAAWHMRHNDYYSRDATEREQALALQGEEKHGARIMSDPEKVRNFLLGRYGHDGTIPEVESPTLAVLRFNSALKEQHYAVRLAEARERERRELERRELERRERENRGQTG